jgi:hypothetical protein
MKAHIMTGTSGPYDIPDIPELPPGRTPVEIARPSVLSTDFNMQAAIDFWGKMATLKKNGAPTGANLPWESMIQSAVTGAMTGSAAPGIGTVLGAVIGVAVVVIGWLFGDRPPKGWEDAGPGVREWFGPYGPQAYLDWIRANAPGTLGDVTAVKRGCVLFMFQEWGIVLTPGQRSYSGIDDSVYIDGAGLDWCKSLYYGMGIDWPATQDLKRAGQPGIMQLVREVAVDINPGDIPVINDNIDLNVTSASPMLAVALLAGAAYLSDRNESKRSR